MTDRHRWRRRCAAALLPLALAACGGGDDAGDPATEGPASCSVLDQNRWLRDYFNEWYLWYAVSPKPAPEGYTTVDAYFEALRYGGGGGVPADRWSYLEDDASFERFFDDGQDLGYGVFVSGLETGGDPAQPLYVRYVEPLSPAASQGVVRGDRILSVNGRSAADIIAADDYAAFTASAVGQTLTLVLRNGGADRSVTLTAAVYDLTPVTTATVVTTPQGRRMGYLVVKDMLKQAEPGFETAFAQFRSAGVTEIVIDLRYNGGGYVSVGAGLASYVAGSRGNGRTYATLRYNDKRAAANDTRYGFIPGLASAAGVARVFVLTGERTCSASEQVVNGLRGIGIDVVTLGDTTCGKPVGFLPVSVCGTTFSIANFSSVNELGQSDYYDGLAATCPVAEDFSRPLGAADEPLLAAARGYADSGACPAPTAAAALKRPLGAQQRRSITEGGRPGGMVAR